MRAAAVPPVLAVVVLCVGLAFAGHRDHLAHGIRIDGVDVGGLTPVQARAKLAARAAALADVPVAFVANGRTWRIKPRVLGVTADWRAAVDTAVHDGGGFAV